LSDLFALTAEEFCSRSLLQWALNIDSFLPDEEECIKALREMRWGDDDGAVRCPSCNSKKVIRDGVRGLYQMYWCKGCDSYFNDRSGTVFQDTKIPLQKWFMIAFLM
jgi:transposase-like protein